MHSNLKALRRLRWLVGLTVLAGIAASVIMNVMHAPDNVWARFVATVPPLFLFGTLELIARIPSSGRMLTVMRVLGAAIVAIGAAAISYAQQRAAVHSLGFPQWEATVWPVIIDGFMVVASVSLVEVVRKIRQMTSVTVTVAVAESPAAPVPAPVVTTARRRGRKPGKQEGQPSKRRPSTPGHAGAGASEAEVRGAVDQIAAERARARFRAIEAEPVFIEPDPASVSITAETE